VRVVAHYLFSEALLEQMSRDLLNSQTPCELRVFQSVDNARWHAQGPLQAKTVLKNFFEDEEVLADVFAELSI
jgi:hypothetical protein